MTTDFKNYISDILNHPITLISPVQGGDISKAYRIDTTNNSFFIKTNTSPEALKMFQAEAYGLQLIAKTNTIKTPKIIACNTYKGFAFLILEHIESKSPSTKNFESLGHQLAQLHSHTSEYFGLDQDSFIGSLVQQNEQQKSWLEFYTQERLLPQLRLAGKNHLLANNEMPSVEQIKNNLQPLMANVKPSLLHGDLWSGNYLISKDDIPYLIDPAVYFGHHEVDIAMTKLFGGFSHTFYEGYNAHISSDAHTQARMEIYQLYYLLVHLNLFGNSYHGAVMSILNTYF